MDWKGVKGVIMKDVAMKRYTSMKVGGPQGTLIYPADAGDLAAILRRLADAGTRPRILGNGTNVIVHDRGVDEALIRITRMRHLRYRKAGNGATVEVSGGVPLTRLIRENARARALGP